MLGLDGGSDQIMVAVESSSTTTLQGQVTNAAGLRRKNIVIPTRNNLGSSFQFFTVFKSTIQQVRYCIVSEDLCSLGINVVKMLCPKE